MRKMGNGKSPKLNLKESLLNGGGEGRRREETNGELWFYSENLESN